jgi:hypothetical protein
MGKPASQLQGLVFGRLTVLHRVGNTAQGKARWKVRCECGKEKEVASHDLTRTMHPTRSCGCLMIDRIRESNTTHGMSEHPAFWVWRSMRDRCRLPTHQAWKNYGGRGIKVCPRWGNFESFWSDMGPTYSSGLTIDRIDNSKGYYRENCRWATYRQQASNKRGNRRIHTPWGYLTVSEASQKSGIGITTILYRLNHQCPIAELFSKPSFTNRFSS